METNSEYDDSTDSDCEHEIEKESLTVLNDEVDKDAISGNLISELYKHQKGECRITGIPFSSGIFAPVLVPRLINQKVSDSNSMLVVRHLEDMRKGTNMGWRNFVSYLCIFSKDASL